MAGERINIATLELDVQQLIKAAQDSKQSILDLRTEQAELAKQGQQSSAQFIRNEVEIRRLSTEYRNTTAAIQAQVSEGGRLQNSQMAINESTSRLNQTESEYLENNKKLKQLRKELNIGDSDYKKNLDEINKKISENNEFLQGTKAAGEGFRNQIAGAIKDTGIFSGSLGALKGDYDNIISVTKAFAPVLNNLKERYAEAIEMFKASTIATEANTVATEAQAVATETTIVATEAEAAAVTGNTVAMEANTVAAGELATAQAVVATEEAILTAETAALAAAQTTEAATAATAAAGTNIFSAALVFLQLVLDALGIGLIIAAVVLLIAAFRNFTPLIDKVEQAMAAVGAAFKVVLNAVISLVTGAKSLGEAFSGLGGDMSDAADSAVKLKKAQQDLEDQMKLQEISTARNRAEINRLNIQAKDKTKTEEERIALLKQAQKAEEDDYNARKKNADEAYRQALEQIKIDGELTDQEFANLKKITDLQINSNANLTASEQEELNERAAKFKEFLEDRTGGVDEMYAALEDSQKKQLELDNEYYVNMEKNINKQNKLIEDAEAAREKAIEAEKKARDAADKAEADRQKKIQEGLQAEAEKMQLAVEAYKQLMEGKAQGVADEIKYAETLRDKQIAANDAVYQASKKTANDLTKLKLANNQAQMDFIEAQSEAVIKNSESEYSAILAANKTKLDANKFLNDEMVKQELERLNTIADAEKDRVRVRLEYEKASQESINTALAEIDAENQKTKDGVIAQRKEADQQRQLIDLENKRAANQENFLVDLQLQADQDAIKRQQEVDEAAKTGADVAAINAKYDAAEKQRAQDVKDFKYQQRADFISGIKGLVSQESKIGKALAIAEIVNNTVQNAAKAFNQAAVYASNPITAPLAVNAAVQGGIIIATGAIQTAKTVGAKLERGGLVKIGGKRHSAGGTLFTGADGTRFEAEQGELIGVMNRRAAASFMDFNNAFLDGGAAPVSSYLATGGIVDRTPAQAMSFDYDLLALKVAQANMALPNPVVTVQDIASANNKIIRVDDVGIH